MRDPRRKSVKLAKSKRRGILFAFLCSASPVIAGNPASSTMTMPPLPLHTATSNNSGVSVNPFCQPTKTSGSGSVQLASGSDQPAVRLLPIGTAIGLHPVKAGEPRRVEQPSITIEAPAETAVQANPLIGSMHHGDRNLVDAMVDETIATASNEISADSTVAPVAEIKRRTSSIVLVPSDPVFIDQVGGEKVNHQPLETTPSKIIAAGSTKSLQWARPTAQRSVAIQPAEDVDAPIEFSFSDDSSNDLAEIDNDIDSELSDSEISETEMSDVVISEDVDSTDSEEAALAFLEPIVIGEEVTETEIERDLTVMEVAPETTAPIVKLEPRSTVHAATASTPEPTLYNKRYRAPVAVTPVPISVGRSDKNLSTQVQTAIEPIAVNDSGSNLTSLLDSDSEATPLYLSRAQVRSLTIGGEVRGVKVNDKSVCQAFAAGPNQLKLIGTGNGVTRLVVWASTDASEDAPQMRAFDIHVSEAVDANGDDAPDRTAMLNQSIQRAFPDADVVVHNRHNELIVAGRCGSEATAKKIVRMVRKTCLVPVRDELVVR